MRFENSSKTEEFVHVKANLVRNQTNWPRPMLDVYDKEKYVL